MRLIRQLVLVFAVLGMASGVMLLFTYDIFKLEWISFMEIQPSFKPMEHPLMPPPRSIPIEGAAVPPDAESAENPVVADNVSLARGAELFQINCQMCHGADGAGSGPIAPFLQTKKPADLTSDVVQSKPDGALFQTVTNGMPGTMPALNENLTVRERWDVINYIRTLGVEPP
jgi:mono/diheme cytochrome c family protein